MLKEIPKRPVSHQFPTLPGLNPASNLCNFTTIIGLTAGLTWKSSRFVGGCMRLLLQWRKRELGSPNPVWAQLAASASGLKGAEVFLLFSRCQLLSTALSRYWHQKETCRITTRCTHLHVFLSFWCPHWANFWTSYPYPKDPPWCHLLKLHLRQTPKPTADNPEIFVAVGMKPNMWVATKNSIPILLVS